LSKKYSSIATAETGSKKMKTLIGVLVALATSVMAAGVAPAETMLFKAAYGEPFGDYIKLSPRPAGGLSLQADFRQGQLEAGVVDVASLDDLQAIAEYTEFPYIHDGFEETIAFRRNEMGVLEAGLPGAIWLLRASYLPGTAPPKRPW